MINLKLSGIAAASAFILSLLIGIASGGGTAISLIRALLCGIVFFALGNGIWVLINRFIPELLMAPSGEDSLFLGGEAGSRVNISVDDDENIPEGVVIPDENGAENDLGNIADLAAPGSPVKAPQLAPGPAAPGPVSRDEFPWEPESPALQEVSLENFNADSGTGMDQNVKESYTKAENLSPGAGAPSKAGFTVSPPPLPLSGTSFGDDAGLEALPDLDAMAGAFMSSGDDDGGEEDVAAAAFPGERKTLSTDKGQSMGGDYNPKDLASAIQTILKKD